jgi:hypothetical protein
MILSEVLDRFIEQTPVTVMVRATLDNVLSRDRLDDLFDGAAVRQRTGELLFSTVADLMGSVVCRIRPSVHAAYQARAESVGVSVRAVYDKLKRVEPGVSRALVRETSERMGAIIRQTGGVQADLLAGYRVLIVDGNHLPATEKRLKEVRTKNVAPLPGHALVVLDPALMLAVDVFPCTDGHASERTLLPELLQTLQPKDLLLADRNFCTSNFLWDISVERQSFFLIRQHGSSLKHELVGAPKKVGRLATGVVYEQPLRLFGREGDTLMFRRITLQLDKPTENGDTSIHLVTNLPSEVDALQAAELYRRRWTVEGAFQQIEATLNSEIDTLAYPQAALFGFCLALVAYNALTVVRAALCGVHGVDKIEQEVSNYYLADEVSGTWRGMAVVLPAEFWEQRFAGQTPSQMAQFLLRCARQVQLSAFRKHLRGPKKKPPNKVSKAGRAHVATQRILNERRILKK